MSLRARAGNASAAPAAAIAAVVAAIFAAVLATLLALSGCTATSREVELGIGWRKGTVVQVGGAEAFGPPVAGDCRARVESVDADRQFVLVEYFSGRILHRRIVPMAVGQEAKVGEPIFISLLGCKESVPR